MIRKTVIVVLLSLTALAYGALYAARYDVFGSIHYTSQLIRLLIDPTGQVFFVSIGPFRRFAIQVRIPVKDSDRSKAARELSNYSKLPPFFAKMQRIGMQRMAGRARGDVELTFTHVVADDSSVTSQEYASKRFGYARGRSTVGVIERGSAANGDSSRVQTFESVAHTIRLPRLLAVGAVLAYPTIAFIRGPLRRWRRRKRGECVNCAYDLTGNVTGVCSECGTAV